MKITIYEHGKGIRWSIERYVDGGRMASYDTVATGIAPTMEQAMKDAAGQFDLLKVMGIEDSRG